MKRPNCELCGLELSKSDVEYGDYEKTETGWRHVSCGERKK